MLLMIDNYDSFTYNLVQYFGELGQEVRVVRNDAMTVAEIAALKPSRIVISPGPCTPDQAGVSLEVLAKLSDQVPILGVCLGHQVIAIAYGATVARASRPRHGMTSLVTHDAFGIFAGVPSPVRATRYHSLSVGRETLPGDLLLSAVAEDDGAVMGIRHRVHPVEGVQFHPESVLTEYGMTMMRNFLVRC